MILTKGQENAVATAVARYKSGERYTCISGMAGTGKTSCLMTIAQSLPGIDMYKDIGFVSYTGKASRVMAQKGLPNVSTIHKLIYKFWKDKYGVSHKSKVESIPYKVIFIDEISMVDFNLLQDLASFGTHIICCGDHAQLPPVNGRDNLLLTKPHAMLDEIVRQEADSGIIKLSHLVKDGYDDYVKNFKSDNAIVLPKESLNTGMLLWADTILCAKNNTRNSINSQVRKLKGYDGDLKDGEKVICLNNYWDYESDTGVFLMNGTTGIAKNIKHFTNNIPYYVTRRIPIKKTSIPTYNFNFVTDTLDTFTDINADKGLFLNNCNTLSQDDEYILSINKKYKKYIPMYFDYGYCLTVHKAQGSEWDNVLVIEEDFPFGKKEHRQWLYTALTRAKKKVVLLR